GGLAQDLNSGPRIGWNFTSFQPLNVVTGVKDDVVEVFGRCPVVMIFAKEADADFVNLVKKIDDRIPNEAKNGKRLHVIAILTTDDDDAKAKLLDLRKKQKIGNIIFAKDHPDGPRGYNLARDAQVTVLLGEDGKVRAKHAFTKGKLDDKAIA